MPEPTCTAPLDAVDAVLDAHVAWLDEQYGEGFFPASGRQVLRDGGVIPGVAEDRTRIEEITAGDSSVMAGVCAYRVTEFVATRTAPEPARHRETPA